MDLPTKSIPTILENFSRNNDILTKVFIGVKDPKPVTCTLEEEFQTPVHRPSVKRMIEEGRPNKFKNVWTPRTGLGYYPFHR